MRLCYPQVPYPSMNNTETLNQVSSGYRMPKPAACPDGVYEIMLQTWDAAPEHRPTFEYLCNFFEEYFAATETGYRRGNDAVVVLVSSQQHSTQLQLQHRPRQCHDTMETDAKEEEEDDGRDLDLVDAEVMNLAGGPGGGNRRRRRSGALPEVTPETVPNPHCTNNSSSLMAVV